VDAECRLRPCQLLKGKEGERGPVEAKTEAGGYTYGEEVDCGVA